MISERILTKTLRYLTHKYLHLQNCGDLSLPAPKSGHSYMLYMHVPFCETLCPFCSFNRYLLRDGMIHSYFESLRDEMRIVADLGYTFHSLYIGGGTPTLSMDELIQTIDLAQQLFGVSEVSCETNPNHLTLEVAGRLEGRVQRLSVGVQSFDDDLLKKMDRYEKFGAGETILRRIQEFSGILPVLNIDMIFNFPGQIEDVLKQDILRIIDSGSEQVSFYPLMTAPSVAELLNQSLGRIKYDHEHIFYQVITDGLSACYRPSSAWTFSRQAHHLIDEYIAEYEEYVGIGSGAFGYLGGRLYVNTFSLQEYNRLIAARRLPLSSFQQFDKREQMRYRFMMELFGLKLDKEKFKKDFGVPVECGLWKEMAFLGLFDAFTCNDKDKILLTPKGRYLLVVMMREFFSSMDAIREQARILLSAEEKELLLTRKKKLVTNDPGIIA